MITRKPRVEGCITMGTERAAHSMGAQELRCGIKDGEQLDEDATRVFAPSESSWLVIFVRVVYADCDASTLGCDRKKVPWTIVQLEHTKIKKRSSACSAV